MDLRHTIMLALQVSILSTVLSIGLNATTTDLLYLLRRPGLLARSLLAVFVIMPVLAVALVRIFDFSRPVEIVLVALAISPVPPILPNKETKAGGQRSFGVGLMAILALVAIVAVPASVEVLGLYFGRPVAIAPVAIAAVILKTVLVPITAGMAIRAALPALATRLDKIVSLIAKVLLPVAILALLAGTFSAIWALVGPLTLLAMTIFCVAGLGIGHLLGGPDPEHAVVLALSTACRHPAIALAVAATNFPDLHFGALIVLYVLVNTIIGIPYIAWNTRQVAGVVHVP
jgi:bile acid:Na+ symporter, BASS family